MPSVFVCVRSYGSIGVGVGFGVGDRVGVAVGSGVGVAVEPETFCQTELDCIVSFNAFQLLALLSMVMP